MNVLAVHPGDLYVRSAFYDNVNAPTMIEDSFDPQRYATPSMAAFDTTGFVYGYPGMMAASLNPRDFRIWRFRRCGLSDRSIVVSDHDGRGLTSEMLLALAARRLCEQSRTWTSAPPTVVLVLPNELAKRVCARI